MKKVAIKYDKKGNMDRLCTYECLSEVAGAKFISFSSISHKARIG